MHRKSVQVKACLLLASAAGLALLSACGGGGGGGGVSGPQATITPRNRVAVPLTGVSIVLGSSTSRRANMRMSPQPDGSNWSGIVFFVEPSNAGDFCCNHRSLNNNDVTFRFDCATGYTGDAVVRLEVNDLGGNKAEGTLQFTCG